MTPKTRNPQFSSNKEVACSEAFGADGQGNPAAEIPPQVLESLALILEGLAVWEQGPNKKETPDEKL